MTKAKTAKNTEEELKRSTTKIIGKEEVTQAKATKKGRQKPPKKKTVELLNT